MRGSFATSQAVIGVTGDVVAWICGGTHAAGIDGAEQIAGLVVHILSLAATGRHTVAGGIGLCIGRDSVELAAEVVGIIGADNCALVDDGGGNPVRYCTLGKWCNCRQSACVISVGSVLDRRFPLARIVVAVFGNASLGADAIAQVLVPIIGIAHGDRHRGLRRANAIGVGYQIVRFGQQFIIGAVGTRDGIAGGIARQDLVATLIVVVIGHLPAPVGDTDDVAVGVVDIGGLRPRGIGNRLSGAVA